MGLLRLLRGTTCDSCLPARSRAGWLARRRAVNVNNSWLRNLETFWKTGLNRSSAVARCSHSPTRPHLPLKPYSEPQAALDGLCSPYLLSTYNTVSAPPPYLRLLGPTMQGTQQEAHSPPGSVICCDVSADWGVSASPECTMRIHRSRTLLRLHAPCTCLRPHCE